MALDTETFNNNGQMWNVTLYFDLYRVGRAHLSWGMDPDGSIKQNVITQLLQ